MLASTGITTQVHLNVLAKNQVLLAQASVLTAPQELAPLPKCLAASHQLDGPTPAQHSAFAVVSHDISRGAAYS